MKTVPFVPNTSDDLHCLQASFMMIAKYFDSSFDIPMDEWSKLTGFEEGKGTWASAGLLWFHNNGYEVKHIENFDAERFVREPEAYLLDVAGPSVGQWQIEHTNIPAEVARTQKLINSGLIERRVPTMEDIKQFIDQGYLCRVTLNMAKLNDLPDYIGQAVTIFDYDNTGLIFHDPGAPPVENRHETFEKFEQAWADPSPDTKELSAIRRTR